MKNSTNVKERTSISHSTAIDGNIKAEEHLVINGTVKGNIEVKNYSLFIGPGGRLEGDVLAQNVKVRGFMQGKINATGKVEITQEAHYSGEIISKGILVEKGAYFEASAKLGRGRQKTDDLQKASSEKPVTEIG
jgi:cytoskeletal protein CcmA (bactofilin family)